MVIEAVASKKKQQCASISFGDDIDLIIDRLNASQQMQQILDIYNKLHQATEGHIKGIKTKYYSQIQKWQQGQKIVIDKEVNLQMNSKK